MDLSLLHAEKYIANLALVAHVTTWQNSKRIGAHRHQNVGRLAFDVMEPGKNLSILFGPGRA